jgi:hypothetical protein
MTTLVETYTGNTIPDAIKAAVAANGYAIASVREPSYELCLLAVQEIGYALRFIPREMQTEELCLAAVRRNGCALEYVWKQTPEICQAAIQQDPEAVDLIRWDDGEEEGDFHTIDWEHHWRVQAAELDEDEEEEYEMYLDRDNRYD